MSEGIFVEISDRTLMRRISRISSPAVMSAMNKQIGIEVTERLKDFLGEMSVSRHKTADRLGAKPTRYFENAPGRTVLKEANAQAVRLASGVTTLADECAKAGTDYETVMYQRARELALAKKLGIAPEAAPARETGEADGEE